jgi:hypothetical protein
LSHAPPAPLSVRALACPPRVEGEAERATARAKRGREEARVGVRGEKECIGSVVTLREGPITPLNGGASSCAREEREGPLARSLFLLLSSSSPLLLSSSSPLLLSSSSLHGSRVLRTAASAARTRRTDAHRHTDRHTGTDRHTQTHTLHARTTQTELTEHARTHARVRADTHPHVRRHGRDQHVGAGLQRARLSGPAGRRAEHSMAGQVVARRPFSVPPNPPSPTLAASDCALDCASDCASGCPSGCP